MKRTSLEALLASLVREHGCVAIRVPGEDCAAFRSPGEDWTPRAFYAVLRDGLSYRAVPCEKFPTGDPEILVCESPVFSLLAVALVLLAAMLFSVFFLSL